MKESLFISLAVQLGDMLNDAPTAKQMNGLWKIFKDYPDDDLRAAFSKAAVSCRFFPKPVELLEILGVGKAALDVEAGDAFALLVKAIRETGGNHGVSFEPVISSIVESWGGWQTVTLIPSEELFTWRRREFVREYKARKASVLDAPTEHPGLIPGPAKRYELPGRGRKQIAGNLNHGASHELGRG